MVLLFKNVELMWHDTLYSRTMKPVRNVAADRLNQLNTLTFPAGNTASIMVTTVQQHTHSCPLINSQGSQAP